MPLTSAGGISRLAGIILFGIMFSILSGIYGLPLRLYNQVLKFDSVKSKMWRGNERILFSLLSIQK